MSDRSLRYEHQVMEYHRKKYGHVVWHWSNVPESVLRACGWLHSRNKIRMARLKAYRDRRDTTSDNSYREYGFDGIAMETTESGVVYHAIQAKIRSDTLLCANHLGTFMSAVSNRLRMCNPASRGYLYHTGRLQVDLRDDWLNSEGIYVAERLPEVEQIVTSNPIDETAFVLRPCQIEALGALLQYASESSHSGLGGLYVASGVGKTVIAGHFLRATKYKHIIVASPFITHALQNLKRISAFVKDAEQLLVDSDSGGVTDLETVDDRWRNSNRLLISTTFVSLENVIGESLFYDYWNVEDESSDEECDDCVNTVVPKAGIDLSDTVLLVDEIHNLIGNESLKRIVRLFPCVIGMTATPPSTLNDDMDGETIYEYSLGQAIKDGFVTDYSLWIPTIRQIDGVWQATVPIPKELTTLDDNLVKKCLFLACGVLETGARRGIVYSTRVEACKHFNEVFTVVLNKYHGKECWTGTITNDMKKSDKKRILAEFSNEDERQDMIHILGAVLMLDECIDIPACDFVFLTEVGESTSVIRTVQRVCRANRLNRRNPNKVARIFMWCDDMNAIVGSLQLLKEDDPEFNKKISHHSGDYDRCDSVEVIAEEKQLNIDLGEFIEVKCLSPQQVQDRKIALIIAFAEEHGRAPSTKKKDYVDGWHAGNGFNGMKRNVKSPEDDLYKKLSVNRYLKESLDALLQTRKKPKAPKLLEEEQIAMVIAFAEEHKRAPRQKEKNVIDGWHVGNGFHRMKQNVKHPEDDLYKKLSVNRYLKESLDALLQTRKKPKAPKLPEEEQIALIIAFAEEHKRAPSHWKKDVVDGWRVGNGFNTMKKNVKRPEDDLYKKLSVNRYLKESLDALLQTRKKPKAPKAPKLPEEEQIAMIIAFAEEHKRAPSTTKKDVVDGWHVGNGFNRMKQNVKRPEDDLYKKLSVNRYLKKSLDELFEKRKEKT